MTRHAPPWLTRVIHRSHTWGTSTVPENRGRFLMPGGGTMRETCDRCSAAAVYAFRQDHRESSLTLCWHHTAAHVDALTEHGWRMLALPARATLEREALAGGRALQL